MRPTNYIREPDGTIRPCHDFEAFLLFLDDIDKRRIACTELGGGVCVSTVFLGLDMAATLDPEHPPILFESMVFGGRWDDRRQRYATEDEARAGHEAMVARIREGSEP